jgi:hypothetical protein
VPLPVTLALWLPLLLTVEEALEVMEGLAPVERVPVGEEEGQAHRLRCRAQALLQQRAQRLLGSSSQQ